MTTNPNSHPDPVSEAAKAKITIMRVLVYQGERAWVLQALSLRAVKGSMVTPTGSIHEAILGDPFALIAEQEPHLTEPPPPTPPEMYACGTPQGADGAMHLWAGPDTEVARMLQMHGGEGDYIVRLLPDGDMEPIYIREKGEWFTFNPFRQDELGDPQPPDPGGG